MSSVKWKELAQFSACDIADALLKLKVPGAGFLPDICPIPSTPSAKPAKVVAPASTFLMVPKASPSFPNPAPTPPDTPASNLHDVLPYSDYTLPGTIVLISQPAGQSCAVLGGIHGLRIAHLATQGIVVDGRVRDLATLRTLGIPVWSRGTSVIGAGAETQFWAREVGIQIGAVRVEPGDIVVLDEEERGVVCVPRGMVDEVLGMLPEMVRQDECCEEGVREGMTVWEAFDRFRT